jgi:serine/threonine protein phosphatase PrpC
VYDTPIISYHLILGRPYRAGEDVVLAKQLRLEAVERTDVGRKRSNNQDNLAQRVPEDPAELERDGALFVVADGMGGYAAGEVASAVAVETIAKTYFVAANGEALQGLAQAIKDANESILAMAREKPSYQGMGTTIVVAVICQGILYVANIGDSRAYLFRKGRMRQITEDHSWVAEQVRAGVLTPEQARNHIHRNVITRSLGTQSSVVADVFVEPVHEGDILLMCSDGLHGYVNDATIADVVLRYEPDEAARRLIDLANEAGGPDNITVSIVRIDEMEEATPELLARLQLMKGQPRATQPTVIMARQQPQDAGTVPVVAAPPSDETPYSAISMSQPVTHARKPSRGALWAIRVAAIVFLVLLSAAVWDYTLGPFAQSRVVAARISADILKVHRDVGDLAAYSVTDRLTLLASDTQLIRGDYALDITPAQRAELDKTLSAYLQPGVQTALRAYNTEAYIVPLTMVPTSSASIPCASTLMPPLLAVTPVKGATASFAALNGQGQIQLFSIVNGLGICGTPFGTDITTIAVTNTGGLAAIEKFSTSSLLITFGAGNAPTTILSLPAETSSLTFTSLLYTSQTIIITQRNQTTGVDTLQIYPGPSFAATSVKLVTLPAMERSIGLGANGVAYILLTNGQFATYIPSASAPLHIVGNLQILPVISGSNPAQYSLATPVPTVPATTAMINPRQGALQALSPLEALLQPQDTGTPSPTPTMTPTPLPTPRTGPSTLLPSAQVIAVNSAAVPFIAVADGAEHRIVMLNAAGVDLGLIEQYADPSALDHVAALAFSQDQHTLYALVGGELLEIPQV